MLHRQLLLAHGDARDRAYGIAALSARRQQSWPAATKTTNETVLVCRPRLRLLSDGRGDDSASETESSDTSSGTDSDSAALSNSDSIDRNAELPPLIPPRLVAELPELFSRREANLRCGRRHSAPERRPPSLSSTREVSLAARAKANPRCGSRHRAPKRRLPRVPTREINPAGDCHLPGRPA